MLLKVPEPSPGTRGVLLVGGSGSPRQRHHHLADTPLAASCSTKMGENRQEGKGGRECGENKGAAGRWAWMEL